MAKPSKPKTPKQVETLKHDEASRKNIPTAEYQSLLESEEQHPMIAVYERRNRDLDPQLVWRGKDEQNWTDLVVPAPPLYIQEKVHPKVLIDDLLRRTRGRRSRRRRPTSSPTSTACRMPRPRRSSTSTTRTGRTG